MKQSILVSFVINIIFASSLLHASSIQAVVPSLDTQKTYIIDNDKVHYVEVRNPFKFVYSFFMRVNKTFIKNNNELPSDRVLFHCVNRIYVEPGQTAQCILPPYQYARVEIDPNNFKNGAEVVFFR